MHKCAPERSGRSKPPGATKLIFAATLQAEAAEAYANRDFKKAVDKLSELIYQQPTSPRWSEMRAQVLVDGKNFAAAVMDYNEAIQRTPGARCHHCRAKCAMLRRSFVHRPTCLLREVAVRRR